MANLQIRNMPPEIHRELKVRAALEGKSMSELVLEQVEVLLRLPSESELRRRLENAEPFTMKRSSAAHIRKERDAA